MDLWRMAESSETYGLIEKDLRIDYLGLLASSSQSCAFTMYHVLYIYIYIHNGVSFVKESSLLRILWIQTDHVGPVIH